MLGYGLDEVGDDTEEAECKFHTVRRHIDGRGIYNASAGVFTVIAGSEIDVSHEPGVAKHPNAKIKNLRDACRTQGTLVQGPDGKYRLTAPVDFSSPSSAAVFVLGGSQNGWTEWVADDGRTLNDVYRKEASNE